MCLRRDAARRVGDRVHVVAVAHRVDGGLRKTHLRPEGSDDKLLAACVLHGLDDTAVLPGVDEGAVDRLLIRKDLHHLEGRRFVCGQLEDCVSESRDAWICRPLGEFALHVAAVDRGVRNGRTDRTPPRANL
jgi:hypothetical protein